MKRVISAGAVIYRREPRTIPPGSVRGERDGEMKFLLLYYGRNYWNFPKGKLEEGERATQAFLREVEEETGLKQGDLRLLSGFRTTERFTFVDRYAHRPVRRGEQPLVFKVVIYYLVEARKREITISDEHEGFGWFTYHEALRIAKYKNTQSILKQAHEFIEKNLPRTTTRVPHHRERR
ncbi:MAG: NUDIX domain-containing protein [bacterium]|nr:NUDIX domain-containing protein [bacterium]